METVQEFPTYGDIYSIYRNKTFQKLRSKRRPYSAKLLETLFEMYPDFKRFVTEKSISIKHLQKHLIRIFQLFRSKEKGLNKEKNFFEIFPFNSDNENTVSVTKDPHSDENSIPVNKDPHSDESTVSVTKDPHSDENSIPVNKDPHSDENSIPVNKNPHSDESTVNVTKNPHSDENSIPVTRDPHSNENSVSVPGQKEVVSQLATKTSKDNLKRKHSQKKEIEDAKRYCLANIWSGYPTIGSIYSTSKLESVRKLKEAQKRFVPLMLKILISKYSRLKILLTDSHLSDDCITEIFLYVLKRAETVEQNFCKKEKRKFFQTIFHSETLSNILIEFSHNKETHHDLIEVENNKNESVVLDTKDGGNTTNNPSDRKENEIEHPLDRVPESDEPTIPSDSVKMHLYQYLKTLKAKYACIQNELSKKRNLERDLEKKLNYLLNKQKKYKHKIKKYRKEIIEYDCSKSICES